MPVKGTINRLLITTVGGVLQPGKEIAEIVPSDDALLLEARISPKDIAFLRPGLPPWCVSPRMTLRFTVASMP